MYHPFSSVINAESIGDNFEFRNNTTIGNIYNNNSLRPRIGNNVILGANVVIFGDIEIGDNVVVGAGTVVNKNIPSNCIVVGNPFRIIAKNENSSN
jgi:serine O-acetyltransferase